MRHLLINAGADNRHFKYRCQQGGNDNAGNDIDAGRHHFGGAGYKRRTKVASGEYQFNDTLADVEHKIGCGTRNTTDDVPKRLVSLFLTDTRNNAADKMCIRDSRSGRPE